MVGETPRAEGLANARHLVEVFATMKQAKYVKSAAASHARHRRSRVVQDPRRCQGRSGLAITSVALSETVVAGESFAVEESQARLETPASFLERCRMIDG